MCYTTQNRHPVGRHGSKLAQGHNGTTYYRIRGMTVSITDNNKNRGNKYTTHIAK